MIIISIIQIEFIIMYQLVLVAILSILQPSIASFIGGGCGCAPALPPPPPCPEFRICPPAPPSCPIAPPCARQLRRVSRQATTERDADNGRCNSEQLRKIIQEVNTLSMNMMIF